MGLRGGRGGSSNITALAGGADVGVQGGAVGASISSAILDGGGRVCDFGRHLVDLVEVC